MNTTILFSRLSLLAMAMTAGAIQTDAQSVGQQSTPGQLVDALHTAFGDNHSRAVHAKGIILEGEFTPSTAAASITKAAHLQSKKSKVILRFSDFTGIPAIPDNSGSANPRGFAIKFLLPDGTTTDIIGHSFNGFPTSNSDQFRELLLAIAVSGTETIKPNTLDRFLDTHPIAKTFLTTQKLPASLGAVNYYGVNSFKFTNKKNETHFIRYQFIPETGEELLTAEQFEKSGANYLMDEIKDRIAKYTIKYKMYAQVAEDGDKIDDPSIAWPDTRTLIFLGTIEIKKMSANTVQEDKALSFIPNNIPAGIETADPMLDFRSKAYPISVKGRQ